MESPHPVPDVGFFVNADRQVIHVPELLKGSGRGFRLLP